MDSAVTAALVGAVAGGAIAIAAGFVTTWSARRRERKAAAQLIFAELVMGYSAARSALVSGDWPSRSGGPSRSAWTAYGAALLPGKSTDEAAQLAQAYGALEDAAWLVVGREAVTDQQYRDWLLEKVVVGLRAVAPIAGRSAAEVEAAIATTHGADAEHERALRFIDENHPEAPGEPGATG